MRTPVFGSSPCTVVLTLWCFEALVSLPIPLSVSLTMADAYVWVSAYFPHTFLSNAVMQAFWKEERQGSAGAWGAGVSPPPGCTPDTASGETKQDATASAAVIVSSAAAPRSPSKCIGLDCDSSSGDHGTYQVSKPNGQCQSTPWVPSSPCAAATASPQLHAYDPASVFAARHPAAARRRRQSGRVPRS